LKKESDMNQALTHLQSILMVEDSEDDFEATSRAFKKVNLRNPVVWCQSGQAALDYLKREGTYKESRGLSVPGLVLLDLNMPGLDGRKTLQAIKLDGDHSDHLVGQPRCPGLLPVGRQHVRAKAGQLRRPDRSDPAP
jgi:CheY-like chemotaxis protein